MGNTLLISDKLTPDADNQHIADERYTPKWLLDASEAILGGIDLDPCADRKKRVNAKAHYTKDDDGLSKAWGGKVFLNPPFSNATEWIKHMCVYCLSSAITEAILLIPVMSLSNKSSRLLMKDIASGFILLERSIAFLDENYNQMPSGAPFPLALVYAGNDVENFFAKTEGYGVSCLIRKNNSENTKTTFCKYCNKVISSRRSTRKYCNVTCRVESHRMNKKR